MLNLTCFQAFNAIVDNQPVRFRSAKDRALLVYLVVEGGRAHRRDALAGLLWPDEPEQRARRNLSTTLLNLRNALDDRERQPPLIEVETQTIAFNGPIEQRIDVLDFDQALRTVPQARARQPFYMRSLHRTAAKGC